MQARPAFPCVRRPSQAELTNRDASQSCVRSYADVTTDVYAVADAVSLQVAASLAATVLALGFGSCPEVYDSVVQVQQITDGIQLALAVDIYVDTC